MSRGWIGASRDNTPDRKKIAKKKPLLACRVFTVMLQCGLLTRRTNDYYFDEDYDFSGSNLGCHCAGIEYFMIY